MLRRAGNLIGGAVVIGFGLITMLPYALALGVAWVDELLIDDEGDRDE